MKLPQRQQLPKTRLYGLGEGLYAPNPRKTEAKWVQGTHMCPHCGDVTQCMELQIGWTLLLVCQAGAWAMIDAMARVSRRDNAAEARAGEDRHSVQGLDGAVRRVLPRRSLKGDAKK